MNFWLKQIIHTYSTRSTGGGQMVVMPWVREALTLLTLMVTEIWMFFQLLRLVAQSVCMKI